MKSAGNESAKLSLVSAQWSLQITFADQSLHRHHHILLKRTCEILDELYDSPFSEGILFESSEQVVERVRCYTMVIAPTSHTPMPNMPCAMLASDQIGAFENRYGELIRHGMCDFSGDRSFGYF
jgi:hypothetical protein